mmetsp:Transcript_266/g.782  ORF Transcript_266/g.782 Transcript_266/m.782 type:complete len:320 (-) Transcript_266:162-1121(-)
MCSPGSAYVSGQSCRLHFRTATSAPTPNAPSPTGSMPSLARHAASTESRASSSGRTASPRSVSRAFRAIGVVTAPGAKERSRRGSRSTAAATAARGCATARATAALSLPFALFRAHSSASRRRGWPVASAAALETAAIRVSDQGESAPATSRARCTRPNCSRARAAAARFVASSALLSWWASSFSIHLCHEIASSRTDRAYEGTFFGSSAPTIARARAHSASPTPSAPGGSSAPAPPPAPLPSQSWILEMACGNCARISRQAVAASGAPPPSPCTTEGLVMRKTARQSASTEALPVSPPMLRRSGPRTMSSTSGTALIL